jgi:3-oxoacyl-[acyl-carrier-protein] synthase II
MSTGSASGNDVIGHGTEMIRRDDLDMVIAGGAEAPIAPTIWAAFCHGKVMTRRGGDPREAMRPFDAERDGFVLGEGAAFLVLEEYTHALARGARIYCEVIAQGSACESYHPVAPHPEGNGLFQAMERAVRRGRIEPTEIDYINAHGTATDANDPVETKAIRRFFGPHADRLAVSSTKPVTGHLMAAAGAIESAICALALHHQIMPPTCNLRVPAADCDLDYVRGKARSFPIRYAMNLNIGFGGKNACLLLRRFLGQS